MKLTCTLTVTVTDETLKDWVDYTRGSPPSVWTKGLTPLEAVRSEIESWLDSLVQDGILISEYELAIREG